MVYLSNLSPDYDLREVAIVRALIHLHQLKNDSGLSVIFSLIHDFNSERLLSAVNGLIFNDTKIVHMSHELLMEELTQFPITIEELRLVAQQPLNRFLSFEVLKR